MATGGRFVSGVASGDPTSSSLVLWARVDGPPVPVTWTIADDADAVQATGVAQPDQRGVVRAEVEGLRPGTDYRYWFSAAQGDAHELSRSPVGRTKTFATRPTAVRLGLACCARWPSGEFTGYRALADRDVDLVVHLGDYIYEDSDGGDRGPHDPPHECHSLDDYDRRYAQYRRDSDLLALHAAAPWVATLDDHEIDDNVARFGPMGRFPAPGVDPERRCDGSDAHARWMPQRTHGNGPTPRDRHVAIGDLCDLVLVDTRLGGREPQVGDGGPAAKPSHAQSPRLLSDEQWEWLDDVIGRSTASWILLASQVQVAPLRLGWRPTRSGSGRLPFRIAPVVNPDQWDGYPTERQRLIDLFDRHDRDDVLVLSGDLHGRFATSIRRPGRPDIAEVTTPSISAPTFASMLDARLPVPSHWTERWIEVINPHIHHIDLHHHGATVIDIDADTIRMTDAVRPDAWEWTLLRDASG
jgi:alkaline phosphatase D